MATVQMAIPSGDSRSVICFVLKVAKTVYHTVTVFSNVSDETLNMLVGLCAGRGALLRIERNETAKLFKRLSAAQAHAPILDDATWAAEMGGSIVGEIEGTVMAILVSHLLVQEWRV